MLLRTFNDQKLNVIAKEIAASKTWICPTLVVNYNFGIAMILRSPLIAG
jgi:hypothetical protein